MPRTTKHQIRVATDIAAPVDVVWVRISDHVGTPTWVHQVECVTLAKDGIPHNGLGAVRVVEFKPRLWSTIHEEITRFEPPHSFEYVLFKGMPSLVSHLGRLAVEPTAEGSRLHWDVDFEFAVIHPFRLFLKSFLAEFEGVLNDGVNELKSQLERERK